MHQWHCNVNIKTALECTDTGGYERWKMKNLTIQTHNESVMVAWLSGNALVLINVVTLRRARLILGWVTVCGQVNHLGM